MSDALITGQKFRIFNVIDDFNREILGIEIDTNLPSGRIVRVLDRIATWRGYPRIDNGPEFIPVTLADWPEKHDVMLDFIKPGKPTQNSYVDRFNKTYNDEILGFYIFRSLKEVREITKT